MDPISKNDEDGPTVVHVQRRRRDEIAGDHHHKQPPPQPPPPPPHAARDGGIVPIEQEAVEDAAHIHLSWRSWV